MIRSIGRCISIDIVGNHVDPGQNESLNSIKKNTMYNANKILCKKYRISFQDNKVCIGANFEILVCIGARNVGI